MTSAAALSVVGVPSDQVLPVHETAVGFVGTLSGAVILPTVASVVALPADEHVLAVSAVTGTSVGSSPVIAHVPGGKVGGAHRWTYLFADLATNAYLGQVPLAQVSFSSVLNGAGQLSAQLLLTDPKVAKALRGIGGGANGLLQTGRTAIYVDLDGQLVWGGILWTLPSYDASTAGGSASHVVKLGAVEFWSYYTQRFVTWDNAYYTNVDQFAIVEDLLYTAQAVPGGNIGLTGVGYLSGVAVSANFDPTQQISVDQAVNTIATQSGSAGFDYAIDVAYNNTKYPEKQLTLSYPRRGRLAGPDSPVVYVGEKTSLGFGFARDSTQQANSVLGVGAGSGPGSSLRSYQEYLPNIADGWPLLEGSLNRSDIITQTTLNGVTRTYLAGRATPVETFTVTLSLDSPVTPFGSYGIGDDCRLIIPPEPLFTDGVDEYQRITGWTVTPGDDGVGTVALTIQAPPVEGAGSGPSPRSYPSSLPAGVTLAHAYNGVTQTYNLGALSRWAAARNRANTNGTFARLNIVGGSDMFGALNTLPETMSPPAQLSGLWKVSYGDGGTGMQTFVAPGVPAAPDGRVATAGFTSAARGPCGVGMVAVVAGAHFYIGPRIPFNIYTLWYWGQPGGGSFTYQLLESAATFPTVTVSTNKPAGWYQETNTATGRADGALYVNVVSGPVTFGSWEAHLNNGGIRVGRIASPGVTAHGIAAFPTATFALPGGAADLAMIAPGNADYEAQSTTFAADVAAQITAAHAAGSDVCLVVPPPDRGPSLPVPQSSYARTLYSLADSHDCAVLDLFDRWDPYVISDPSFYKNTTSLPSNIGAADIATAIFQGVR